MEVKDIVKIVSSGQNMDMELSKKFMEKVIAGEVTDSQISAVIIAIKMRGACKEEILGFLHAMRSSSDKLKLDGYTIDTCGTGGDGKGTFNISTLVSLIATAGGVKVAKHGNRGVSSKSGSADVLSKLGYNIDLSKESAEKSIREQGFAFIYAPKYNQSMKNVANTRRDLGVRTIFNLMGPLIHPGDIKGQMVGIYDGNMTNIYAEVLKSCGRERAMVVYGEDGLDEITITTNTKVSELKDGKITNYIIDPRKYGFKLASHESIMGGTPEDNMRIMFEILEGEKNPKRDITILNSAAALYIGKAVRTYEEGIELSKYIIDSGKGLDKLNEIIEYNKGVN